MSSRTSYSKGSGLDRRVGALGGRAGFGVLAFGGFLSFFTGGSLGRCTDAGRCQAGLEFCGGIGLALGVALIVRALHRLLVAVTGAGGEELQDLAKRVLHRCAPLALSAAARLRSRVAAVSVSSSSSSARALSAAWRLRDSVSL